MPMRYAAGPLKLDGSYGLEEFQKACWQVLAVRHNNRSAWAVFPNGAVYSAFSLGSAWGSNFAIGELFRIDDRLLGRWCIDREQRSILTTFELERHENDRYR